jgi:hypothetical protein
MNTTKFWISSITAVATAGALGLAIAQTTDQKPDQGGSTTGGAAAQEPAPKSMSTDSSASSSSDSSTGAQGASTSTPASEQPMAKADRG